LRSTIQQRPSPNSSDLFATVTHDLQFKLQPAAPDETSTAAGSPNAKLEVLLDRLSQITTDELIRRQTRIDQINSDAGFSFSSSDNKLRENNLTLQMDPIPRIIRQEEWVVLEKGLTQRTRAFDLFLADVFSEQCILRDKVIPYSLVLGDPAYLRLCKELHVPKNQFITFGAVDLIRTADGQWLVSHNHYSAPAGVSLVLQQRRTLTQVFPELFETFDVHPVFSFAAQLVEALARLSPEPFPHIVMLSRSVSHEAFFEESFLARRMGIGVVRPGDLLVREGKVFLKTVTGLEKVDVIFRRVGSSSIDPIAFSQSRFEGVPGLVNCVRKGTVAIGNALGCGVADNKALLRYSDAIIRYYLREDPILRTIPTYYCGDPDQLEYVTQHLGDMVLKPVHRDRNSPRLINDFTNQMNGLLKKHPETVVAQPRMMASLYPRLQDGELVKSAVYLRAFTLLGKTPYVLPGGLTRASLEDGPQDQLADGALGAKDTWVLGASTRSTAGKNRTNLQPFHQIRDLAISSRVAESLYWIARYSERAENTARMIRVLEEARWEELSTQSQAMVWPLWQAVATATGKEELLEEGVLFEDTLPLSRRLVIDPNDSASVLSSLQSARFNAQSIREFVTPELFGAINRACVRLEISSKSRAIAHGQLVQLAQSAVDDLACISGTAMRTMPHDDSWQFFKIGSFLERAISTVSVLEIVLPRAAAAAGKTDEEDPDLTTLLRLLGSLDAYRREFRSRAQPLNVAELLWRNRQTPSSVAFCCQNILYAVSAVLTDPAKRQASPVVQTLNGLLEELDRFDSASMFPMINPDAEDFDLRLPASFQTMRSLITEQSVHLKDQLEKIHTLLDDHFYNHQSDFSPPDEPSSKIAA
jgi:uncharacterized circularly permuted ATP-grasp superfamily protein/uncharacterized alpha-E superfamily protein